MTWDLKKGKVICENLGISPKKLAEYCHSGSLTAYRYGDQRKILSSEMCVSKFKFPDNTSFRIKPPANTVLVAINKKSAENFNIYVGRKSNKHAHYQDPKPMGNNFVRMIHENSRRATKNTEPFEISHLSERYLLYPKEMLANIFKLRFHSIHDIIFEAKDVGSEVVLEFIAFIADAKIKVERYTVKLCLAKVSDKNNVDKVVITACDSGVIDMNSSCFGCKGCGVYMDKRMRVKDAVYDQKCKECCIDMKNYAVDYFRIEDAEKINPLKIGVDYFIFDYEEYRKQFYFLEEELVAENSFYGYLENFVYSEQEIVQLKKSEKGAEAIRRDPRAYMIERCKELEEFYRDTQYAKEEEDYEQNEEFKIVKCYRLALEGVILTKIHARLWKEKRKQDDDNNSRSYASRKTDEFEKIAQEHKIPFIKADEFRKMNSPDKEAVIIDKMIKQLDDFETKRQKEARRKGQNGI